MSGRFIAPFVVIPEPPPPPPPPPPPEEKKKKKKNKRKRQRPHDMPPPPFNRFRPPFPFPGNPSMPFPPGFRGPFPPRFRAPFPPGFPPGSPVGNFSLRPMGGPMNRLPPPFGQPLFPHFPDYRGDEIPRPFPEGPIPPNMSPDLRHPHPSDPTPTFPSIDVMNNNMHSQNEAVFNEESNKSPPEHQAVSHVNSSPSEPSIHVNPKFHTETKPFSGMNENEEMTDDKAVAIPENIPNSKKEIFDPAAAIIALCKKLSQHTKNEQIKGGDSKEPDPSSPKSESPNASYIDGSPARKRRNSSREAYSPSADICDLWKPPTNTHVKNAQDIGERYFSPILEEHVNSGLRNRSVSSANLTDTDRYNKSVDDFLESIRSRNDTKPSSSEAPNTFCSSVSADLHTRNIDNYISHNYTPVHPHVGSFCENTNSNKSYSDSIPRFLGDISLGNTSNNGVNEYQYQQHNADYSNHHALHHIPNNVSHHLASMKSIPSLMDLEIPNPYNNHKSMNN